MAFSEGEGDGLRDLQEEQEEAQIVKGFRRLLKRKAAVEEEGGVATAEDLVHAEVRAKEDEETFGQQKISGSPESVLQMGTVMAALQCAD